MDQTSSSLLQLPLEVLEMVIDYLSKSDKSKISRCTKDFYSLLTPMIYQEIEFEASDLRSANLLYKYTATPPWTGPWTYMTSTREQRMSYKNLLSVTSLHPKFFHLRHLTIPHSFPEPIAELLGPNSYLRTRIESLTITSPSTVPTFPDLYSILDPADWIFEGFKMCAMDYNHVNLYHSLIREEEGDEEAKSEYPGLEWGDDYENLLHRCFWLASIDIPNNRHWLKLTLPKNSGLGDTLWKHYFVHTFLAIEHPSVALLAAPDPFWILSSSFTQLRTLQFGINSLHGQQIIRSIFRTNILPALLDLTISFGTDDTQEDTDYSVHRFNFSDWLLLKYSCRMNRIQVIYGPEVDSTQLLIVGTLEDTLQPLNSTENAFLENFLFPYLGPNLNRLCLEFPLVVYLEIGSEEDE